MHDQVFVYCVTTANFGIILSPLREALITFQLLAIRLLLTPHILVLFLWAQLLVFM